MSGLELAILASAKPVLERAAGTALGKLISGPLLGSLQSRFRNRATRARLREDPGADATPSDLSAEFTRSLIDYLDSADFGSLAMSVAAQKFAESRRKKQVSELESAKQNLRDSLSLLAGAGPIDMDVLVGAIWQSLVDAISQHTHQVKAANELPAESRAAVVRMAANFARADVMRSDFVRDADGRAKYELFESSLKEQAKSMHATMKLPHAGTTRRVAYSRLFVEPRFALLEGQGKARIPSPPPGLDSIISSSHRTVILGDPGGGKSTLSLKLTYDIARDGFSASAARIPFLVILRDYTRDFEAGNTTMVQYLEALCRSPYNMDPPAGFVEHALTSGRAFVIFDGLDELIDTSLRRKVVELVESFAYRYPMTPILVTTRKVGYEEAPLDSSLFHAVQLGQLDDDGVKSYADKWFMLDNTLEKNRRVELSASFFQDSRFVADLTQNPLMLSLMCGIYASENYIPANRPEVYKKCTELLFDKWDKQRGIVTPLPFDAHVKHAINALAYAIYSDSKHRSGLTRDRLIRFVKDFLLAKRFEDDDEAENAATQFVEFCTGRAWVLSNVGSDESQELYGFTHRTFLEYFAANQLVRLNPTAEQLFGKLLDKISHAEWDVVSQLAVQIIGNNTEDGMDDFLERVIGAAEKSPIEEKANLLAFAGRALGFAVPKPALVRQICQASVAMAMGNPSEGTPFRRDRYAQLRGVRAVLHANSENLPSVAKYLRASLRVEDSSIEAREVCLALALSISLVPYAGIDDASYMTSKAREYWNDFEAENFDEFAAEMDSLAEHRGWAALYAAVAGRRPIRHVIDAYGPEVLFQFHSGPLTLRPPVVMRIDPYSDVRSRSDWALDTCLSDLSVILPRCETPWFVSEYDYDPIGKLGRHAFGAFFGTLSDFPEEHRDAVILLAAAWIELGGGPRQAFDGRADGRIVLLMQKWNAARIGQRPVSHALRSIRSTKVSGRVVELLEAWVQGRLRFTRKPIPVAESAAAETQC